MADGERRRGARAAVEAAVAGALPPDYTAFLTRLKEQIRGAQVGAMLAANRELRHCQLGGVGRRHAILAA